MMCPFLSAYGYRSGFKVSLPGRKPSEQRILCLASLPSALIYEDNLEKQPGNTYAASSGTRSSVSLSFNHLEGCRLELC